MNEFVLNDQCGTSNNLIFSCVLDDRYKVVATCFHSMKSTEKLRMRNITNARQLREQFEKTTIVVSFQQWPHYQPWFTRIDGCNWWIEFGDRFAPVQFIQKIAIVKGLFSLKEKNKLFHLSLRAYVVHFVLFINIAIENPDTSSRKRINYAD